MAEVLSKTSSGLHIVLTGNCSVKWFHHGDQIFWWRQMSLNMCWQSVSVSGTASAQGPETKFSEIFDDLFTTANSHNKFSRLQSLKKFYESVFKKKSGWIFFSKKLQIYVIFYCFIGTSVILTDWKMFSPYVWCRRDRENSVFNTMTMKALC